MELIGTHIAPLPTKCLEILDFVFKAVSGLSWHDIVKLTLSTYPMITQPKDSELDLAVLADEYKEKWINDISEIEE